MTHLYRPMGVWVDPTMGWGWVGLGRVGSSKKIQKCLVYNSVVTDIRSRLPANKVATVKLVRWGCEMDEDPQVTEESLLFMLCSDALLILTCMNSNRHFLITAHLQVCLRFDLGWVVWLVSIQKFLGRVGFGGWVCWILRWIGLGQEIWTYVHLSVLPSLCEAALIIVDN